MSHCCVVDRPIMSAKYCLPVPVFHFWPKLTHAAVRSLCDSWATCTFSPCFKHLVAVVAAVSDASGRSVAVYLPQEQTARWVHQSPSSRLLTWACLFTRVCWFNYPSGFWHIFRYCAVPISFPFLGGFNYFLLLSIPFHFTRRVPLRFQAGGRRKRPNLGLVCSFYFVLSVFLKMDFGVLLYWFSVVLCLPSVLWHCWLGHLTRKTRPRHDL